MKVAVTCDAILGPSHRLEVVQFALEALGEIADQCEIYTLVHRSGSASTLEAYPIHSSYLSNFITTPKELTKWAFLLPGAARALRIPCSFDFIFNVSSGFSHGIRKCSNTRQITYFYDDKNIPVPKGVFSHFFNSYLRNWVQKNLSLLSSSDELWLSSKCLGEVYREQNTKISYREVPLPFKLSSFPLFPEEQRKILQQDFYLIAADGLCPTTSSLLMGAFEEVGAAYKFVGSDDHLAICKSGTKDKRFLGPLCSGELAPLLAGALAVVDFQVSEFPAMAMAALATGGRAIVLKSTLLSGKGVLAVDDMADLRSLISGQLSEVDPQQARAGVIEHHDLKFKAHLRRKAKDIVLQESRC